MRKETVEAKLNKLFNLTEKAEEVKVKTTGRVVGVTESEIQEFREVQGLVYFLAAPALFELKTCPVCEEWFAVSRKYVAYCSYICIKRSLEKVGIRWSKGQDIEALVNDPQVYDGNEPIWINQKSLEKLREMVLSLPSNLPLPEDKPSYESLFSPPPVTTTSSTTASSISSLFPNTTTTSGTSTSSSKTRKTKRRIISSA